MAGICLLSIGCSELRHPDRSNPPTFAREIGALLSDRCGACHLGPDAMGGFRVDTYLDVTACPASDPSTPATEAGDAGTPPPLLAALDQADHSGILSTSDKAQLAAWLGAGAPLRRGGVHRASILDPRSPDWHGKLASVDGYAPLKDPNHPGACGRCHEGAPVTPAGITKPAEGAPACTSCHTAQSGVLACGTCHGDGARRAAPPRDSCRFPISMPDAHRAHLESTRIAPHPLTCNTCHPTADARLDGTHANGQVDIAFDPERAGASASYDRATGQCTVACHSQGGARPTPTFHDSGPLTCGDCHGAPPAEHYEGRCDFCHHTAAQDGGTLTSTALHLNGKIDLGDASGTCAACHGSGDDPMPKTPSHTLHRQSTLTAPIACTDCHVVPSMVADRSHLEARAMHRLVTFGERAKARSAAPAYDGTHCTEIACHGAGLPEGQTQTLTWDASVTATCESCHGAPPTQAHPSDPNCASVLCHGGEISADRNHPTITPDGTSRHIDGNIDLMQR